MQVKTVQYGLGNNGPKSAVTGQNSCGELTMTKKELEAQRCAFGDEIQAHPLDDDYHRERSPIWDKVVTPFLSAGNWGGQGLHPRGNFEGYIRAASKEKWLEVHGIEHWTEFYTDYGVQLQKRFFDFFLKGDQESWNTQAKVQLQVRHPDRFEVRAEEEWPIPRTQWTKYYIDLATRGLSENIPDAAHQVSFETMGEGLTFRSPPLDKAMEITGPSALKLGLSSSTADADVFVILQVFTPGGDEVVFQGAIDPHTPIGQGWLRASHRKLDEKLSEPYRPYHTHDEIQPLTPGEKVELDVEIWPTSIVVPKGYRFAICIRGKDYEYSGESGGRLSNFKNELKGCGPFLHDDPRDRPADTFNGTSTLHSDPDNPAFVLLPIIPSA
jgi:predicted acyl esterase